MDFGRSFTYMFSQDGWVGKILIGGLLLFVPIIGWAIVAGYALQALRSIAAGSERLPDWGDWGDLLSKGFLLLVGGFVYNLPGYILSFLGDFGSLLSSLWGLVVFVVFPAAMIRFAATGQFGSMFHFNEIIAFIQKNISNYVIALLLALVAGFIAGFGFILLIVGVVFTIFWSSLVSAHLFGSVYRVSLAGAGGPAGAWGQYPTAQPPAPYQQPGAPGQYPQPGAPGQYQQPYTPPAQQPFAAPPAQQPYAPPAPPAQPPYTPPAQPYTPPQPPYPPQAPPAAPPMAPPVAPPMAPPVAPPAQPPYQAPAPPVAPPPAPPAPPAAPPAAPVVEPPAPPAPAPLTPPEEPPTQ